jgi:3-hydroxybutyrate dehydrogenase
LRALEQEVHVGGIEKVGEAAMSLDGRRALVTGAGSGIGLAIARRLRAAGARLVLVDLDEPAVARAADELGATGHVLDVSDVDALQELDADIDILVNNAGFQHVAPVHEFPVEVFATMQAVMVTAPFVLARRVLPHMYDRSWGRVVNVSSIHGSRASEFKSAYVAAKHGLEGLSKVIALEGGGRGVTSNCISPAYVRTPLVEKQLASQAAQRGIAESDVLSEVMLAKTAVKRLVEVEEVAEVAAFLCGPAGAMINGATIPVDGGWTAQ